MVARAPQSAKKPTVSPKRLSLAPSDQKLKKVSAQPRTMTERKMATIEPKQMETDFAQESLMLNFEQREAVLTPPGKPKNFPDNVLLSPIETH